MIDVDIFTIEVDIIMIDANQRLSTHRYSRWVSAYGFVSARVLNLNG